MPWPWQKQSKQPTWESLLGGALQPPPQQENPQLSVPGTPGWDPNTLANRYDDPSVMEPKWLSLARKLGQGLGQIGEMGKGLVTGGSEQPGATAENFGGILGAALPFAGPVGFYSRVNRVAEGIPAQIHPNKLMALLKSGASQEEVAYRNLPEFIQQHGNQMISRDDLWKYLTEHQAPEVGVVRKVGRQQHFDDSHYDPNLQGGTKYQDYQVPGGENYRETLMTLKSTAKPTEAAIARKLEDLQETGFEAATMGDTEEAERIHRLALDIAQGRTLEGIEPIFQSPHWNEPNVLVHGRTNERRLPGDKPLSVDDLTNPQQSRGGVWIFDAPYAEPPITQGFGLGDTQEAAAQAIVKNYGKHGRKSGGSPGHLVENVQSDWHQTGRREGYQATKLPPQYQVNPYDTVNGPGFYVDDIVTLPDKYGVLPNPLSGPHETVEEATTEGLRAYNQDRSPDAPFKDSWPDLQLKQEILDAANNPKAEWIGITDSPTLRHRGETISPEFQDKRLPDTLKKLLKPFGGTGEIEDVKLSHDMGIAARAWIARLTPEMKARIKAEGFPLMTLALMAVQADRASKER